MADQNTKFENKIKLTLVTGELTENRYKDVERCHKNVCLTLSCPFPVSTYISNYILSLDFTTKSFIRFPEFNIRNWLTTSSMNVYYELRSCNSDSYTFSIFDGWRWLKNPNRSSIIFNCNKKKVHVHENPTTDVGRHDSETIKFSFNNESYYYLQICLTYQSHLTGMLLEKKENYKSIFHCHFDSDELYKHTSDLVLTSSLSFRISNDKRVRHVMSRKRERHSHAV